MLAQKYHSQFTFMDLWSGVGSRIARGGIPCSGSVVLIVIVTLGPHHC